MSSRDAILAAVRAARPPLVELQSIRDVISSTSGVTDLSAEFTAAAELAGARVVHATRNRLDVILPELYSAGRTISVTGEVDAHEGATPHSFSDSHIFVCEAVIGVAENGAVWLPLSRLRHRAAVFLATNVIVLLDRNRIVNDLHTAYETVNVAEEGFGVFIAGPSKTADIEQALVIGAQGAMSLTIVLLS